MSEVKPLKPYYIHGTDPSEQQRLEALAKVLGGADFLPQLDAGMRILDVGCGTGAIAREVAIQVAPEDLIGLDFQDVQIRTARRLARSRDIRNVCFVQGDANTLSFRNNSFDGAYCRFLLEHVANPLIVLQEMSRVVKPGGWVCAYEWENGCFIIYPESPAIERVWHGIFIFQRSRGGDPWVARKLYGLFLQAGLKDVRVEGRAWTITSDEREKLQLWVNGSKEIIRQTLQGLLDEHLVTQEILKQADGEFETLMKSSKTFVFHGFCLALGKKKY
ncbi:MAG: methyltransferase domain-containing protein [Nitrososphaerota archaeon]